MKKENQVGLNKSLMKMLNKILVANRGEIAVRIIRTLKKIGIQTIAVYSYRDREALHVRLADEAYDLGGNDLKETYLDISKIVHIAKQSGADGIHPGYGFLSENADFAMSVEEAGIKFIGPAQNTIRLMGDKIMARKTMREIEIPLIEGFEGTYMEILEHKNDMVYPLLVKAAAGGGGKAMRIVPESSKLEEILEITSREAVNYFGNGLLFVEQYIEGSRHIEVQVIADHFGNILILGERECSVQRRYQKVIEESPALSISQETRDSLYRSAYKIAKKIGYTNAGTIEFLVDKNGDHFFLEMNTRIQVEHPVTEMVTGLDLVDMQVQISAGNKLLLKQKDIRITGHAIEARLYSEDPENDFLPSPGKIKLYHQLEMPGLRIDSGIDGPDTLHPEYDPLIAKLIFHGSDRKEAIAGLNLALKSFILHGPKTNREFIGEILGDPGFQKNIISTQYLDDSVQKFNASLKHKKSEFPEERILAAWLAWILENKNHDPDKSIWTRIGPWRIQIRKSVLLKAKQFDIIVEKIAGPAISFSIGNIKHEMIIKSQSKESIIFELDGIWSDASVSHAFVYEDLICIEGLDFKIRPLDYLPDQPYLIDHQDIGLNGTRVVKAPLHGKIVRIDAEPGSMIKKGDLLFSLDAMKIENKVTSLFDGCIKEINVKSGEQVQINQTIMIIDEC